MIKKIVAGNVTAFFVALGLSIGACAGEGKIKLDIKSQNIGPALMELGEKAGVQIMFPQGLGDNASLVAVQGEYTLSSALDLLLAGSGLQYEFLSENAIAIKQGSDSGQVKEKSDVSNESIEEMIVTAQRREQALQDVPMSISVIKTSDFVNSGFATLTDVAAFTPGVFTTNSDGNPRGGGTITMRGVGQQGGTAVVGVYVDDVAVTSAGPFGGGAVNYFDAMLLDVSRIEFLKGPQGTLYGAGSVGGAVKYITRKPSLDEIRGDFSADLSSIMDGGVKRIYNGRVSTPLISDKVGITVSGFYEKSDGFIDRLDTSSGTITKEDINAYDSKGFSAELYALFTDNIDLRLRYMEQEADYDTWGRIEIDQFGQPLVGTRVSTVAGDNVYQQKNSLYSGSFEYRMSWATLAITSAYTEQDAPSLLDLVPFYGPLVDDLEGNPVGTTTEFPLINVGNNNRSVQEVRLTSEDSDSIEWLVGAFYVKEDMASGQNAIAQPTNFNLLVFETLADYKELAAFGNVTVYLTPEFDLSAGVRVSSNEMHVFQNSTGALGTNMPVNAFVDDTVATWLFSGRYRLNEDMSLYSRIASGYRPASPNLPLSIPGVTVPSITESDSLWSYELGAKGKLANGFLTYDISAYYIDWDNFQANLGAAGLTFSANADAGIISKGIEGQMVVQPMDGLDWTLNVAYTDSTLNQDDPFLNGLKGQQMPYTPKWSVSSLLRYEFALTNDIDAHVGGGIRYVGSMNSSFDDDDPTATLINVKADSYTLADFNVGVSLDNISLQLYITNLFDDDTPVYPLGFGFFTSTAAAQRPRTVGLNLNYSF